MAPYFSRMCIPQYTSPRNFNSFRIDLVNELPTSYYYVVINVSFEIHLYLHSYKK